VWGAKKQRFKSAQNRARIVMYTPLNKAKEWKKLVAIVIGGGRNEDGRWQPAEFRWGGEKGDGELCSPAGRKGGANEGLGKTKWEGVSGAEPVGRERVEGGPRRTGVRGRRAQLKMSGRRQEEGGGKKPLGGECNSKLPQVGRRCRLFATSSNKHEGEMIQTRFLLQSKEKN